MCLLTTHSIIGFTHSVCFEILAHLALHLVDLPELEHALADDRPGLVGVGVVADHLGGDHEGTDEQAVA